MKRLFKIDANGSVRSWSINSDRNIITIIYGNLGGIMQTETEDVQVNQSGRSLVEQVNLRVDSRVNKQLDKGYKYTVEEARQTIGMNASNLLRPMLAKKFIDVKNIDFKNAWVQSKFNGHRCMIHMTEDGPIAYSRNGKPITSVDHILAEVDIPVGTTLDGELYIHGVPLQQLSSIIRRNQVNSGKLNYICYDVVKPEIYAKRIDWLCNNILSSHVHVAESIIYRPSMNLNDIMAERILDGYEGLMLRQGTNGYEPGKRSSQLLKLKQTSDAEFKIVDIQPSKDGWGILECEISPGKTFKVSAPGTMENKHDFYINSHKYIGKMMSVEFFEITDGGIPFHPVAVGLREDE